MRGDGGKLKKKKIGYQRGIMREGRQGREGVRVRVHFLLLKLIHCLSLSHRAICAAHVSRVCSLQPIILSFSIFPPFFLLSFPLFQLKTLTLQFISPPHTRTRTHTLSHSLFLSLSLSHSLTLSLPLLHSLIIPRLYPICVFFNFPPPLSSHYPPSLTHTLES